MQYVKAVCVVLLNLAGLLVSAQSFELNTASDGKGDSGYWTKWDSTHNRLLMYRDSSSPDTPSARVLSGSGTSVPIFILHGSTDDIIPSTESLWLQREVPPKYLREVLITPAFSHVDPEKSATWVDQFRLVGFLADVLHAADR